MRYVALLFSLVSPLLIGVSCVEEVILSAETETVTAMRTNCRSLSQRGGDPNENCEAVERHIQYLEQRMTDLCGNAGEEIQRTIDKVEGIYIRFPKDYRDGPRYYHEDDRLFNTYIGSQIGKHYTFVEMDSPSKDGVIFHWYYEPDKIRTNPFTFRQLDQPEAKYEVTWKALTDEQTQRYGLYGDELTIVDRDTKRILASRKIYFYVIRDGTIDRLGRRLTIWPTLLAEEPYRFVACKKYHPGYTDKYIDKRPRDSSEFVTRVLRPKTTWR